MLSTCAARQVEQLFLAKSGVQPIFDRFLAKEISNAILKFDARFGIHSSFGSYTPLFVKLSKSFSIFICLDSNFNVRPDEVNLRPWEKIVQYEKNYLPAITITRRSKAIKSPASSKAISYKLHPCLLQDIHSSLYCSHYSLHSYFSCFSLYVIKDACPSIIRMEEKSNSRGSQEIFMLYGSAVEALSILSKLKLIQGYGGQFK